MLGISGTRSCKPLRKLLFLVTALAMDMRKLLLGVCVAAAFLAFGGLTQAQQPDPSGQQAKRFVVLPGDDWVLDTNTALRWQRSPGIPQDELGPCSVEGLGCPLQEAMDYCAALDGNARVPEIRDLHSLVDFGVAFPGPVLTPGHPFTNVDLHGPRYWSKTPLAEFPENAAWTVEFLEGKLDIDDVTVLRGVHVWCVR